MNGGGGMSFVDSHAHLADPAFDDDRDAVIARARSAGCVGIVCIGESIAAARQAAVIAGANRGFVVATAGVHPHDAVGFDAARDLDALRALVAGGAVAIGECGLDYHYDNSPRETQRRVFAAQLELAAEVRRPVVVHTRDAEEDTIRFVNDARAGGVIGVLHCFSGGPALCESALSAGWFISFAGVVTFKKWQGDDLIRAVPDSQLLVESDAPYLTPVPLRGKRNEPAHVVHTVARVAAARAQSPHVLGEVVAANAKRCFQLPGNDVMG
jgi:TatD DNase family protein